MLIKPEAGLATPTVFKALDLSTRSTADPEELLKQLGKGAKHGEPVPCGRLARSVHGRR